MSFALRVGGRVFVCILQKQPEHFVWEVAVVYSNMNDIYDVCVCVCVYIQVAFGFVCTRLCVCVCVGVCHFCGDTVAYSEWECEVGGVSQSYVFMLHGTTNFLRAV